MDSLFCTFVLTLSFTSLFLFYILFFLYSLTLFSISLLSLNFIHFLLPFARSDWEVGIVASWGNLFKCLPNRVVHLNMKIMSSFNHPYVVTNLYGFLWNTKDNPFSGWTKIKFIQGWNDMRGEWMLFFKWTTLTRYCIGIIKRFRNTIQVIVLNLLGYCWLDWKLKL